ncbi:MAG: hypothetical protein BroJett042_25390 [Bacteroidota bacterium]|nr:MAG: hypothetical protein BroJett042_25390 [Bacteroidota bacterium]
MKCYLEGWNRGNNFVSEFAGEEHRQGQGNIKKPQKIRYEILDPARGTRYVDEKQYRRWYRVHFYLGNQ